MADIRPSAVVFNKSEARSANFVRYNAPDDVRISSFDPDAANIKRLLLSCLVLSFFLAGCSVPPPIPGIPKDHPANGFYQHASRSLLSDKGCRDYRGSPDIPMGEIAKGERYRKTEPLASGVFRFVENATGKTYLAVSYMKRSGFLQLPQACVWEEKTSG